MGSLFEHLTHYLYLLLNFILSIIGEAIAYAVWLVLLFLVFLPLAYGGSAFARWFESRFGRDKWNSVLDAFKLLIVATPFLLIAVLVVILVLR